ncbi:MAG: SAM-dependent methyltransferase [Saprospiraceae bacterium]|nr:SAM-dependent methyltransferase [Candidatus Vicinibacter affinis]
MQKASLHLIPFPLTGAPISQMSIEAMEAARLLDCFLAERGKTARHFIKALSHPLPQSAIEVVEIGENLVDNFNWLLGKINSGHSVGLVSEAGMPCIADPGAELVKFAHKHGIRVVPHAGPNSMMMALMASGFSGQQYQFHGYLPAKKELLRESLIKLGQTALNSPISHIFMETPYRNKQMFQIAFSVLPQSLDLCIATGLGSSDEIIKTMNVKLWKTENLDAFTDKPSIFILSKP